MCYYAKENIQSYLIHIFPDHIMYICHLIFIRTTLLHIWQLKVIRLTHYQMAAPKPTVYRIKVLIEGIEPSCLVDEPF